MPDYPRARGSTYGFLKINYSSKVIVWELQRAMYGLRVAPKSWQDHFAEVLQRHNYKRGQYEACVFYYDSDDEPLYALVHVDDILAVGARQGYEKFRKILGDNFLVKDIGDLNAESSTLDLSWKNSH